MFLNKFYIPIKIAFLLFFQTLNLIYADDTLKTLIPKQQLSKIRFISNNGKYTYYLNHSGGLNVSSNYSVSEVQKGKEESTFFVASSLEQKKVVIEQNEETFTDTTLMKNNSLFFSDMGSLQLKILGKGMNPELHFHDTWASYFSPREKKIIFKKLDSLEKEFSIQLQNSVNPFFIPTVTMVNEQDIFFTDINSKGVMGLLYFQRNSKKILPLIKAPRNGVKIEICFNSPRVFVGFFGYPDIAYGTDIYQLNMEKTHDFSKLEKLYHSDLNDIGQMECYLDSKFFHFIKTYKKNNTETFEVVEFNIKKKEAIPLTKLDFVTQLQSMGGMLLVPYHEKYYVLKGQNDFTQDQLKEMNIPNTSTKSSKNSSDNDE